MLSILVVMKIFLSVRKITWSVTLKYLCRAPVALPQAVPALTLRREGRNSVLGKVHMK